MGASKRRITGGKGKREGQSQTGLFNIPKKNTFSPVIATTLGAIENPAK